MRRSSKPIAILATSAVLVGGAVAHAATGSDGSDSTAADPAATATTPAPTTDPATPAAPSTGSTAAGTAAAAPGQPSDADGDGRDCPDDESGAPSGGSDQPAPAPDSTTPDTTPAPTTPDTGTTTTTPGPVGRHPAPATRDGPVPRGRGRRRGPAVDRVRAGRLTRWTTASSAASPRARSRRAWWPRTSSRSRSSTSPRRPAATASSSRARTRRTCSTSRPDQLSACARAAQRAAKRIIEKLDAAGMNLIQSSRPAAWQTVFHFHVHVIPRYKGDPLVLAVTPPSPADPTTLDETAEALREHLRMP